MLIFDEWADHFANLNCYRYGLAYAGVGWLVFREKKYLPDEVVFTVNCGLQSSC